jgi:hypothetical protein
MVMFVGFFSLHGDTNSASLLATIHFSGDNTTKFHAGTPLSFECKIKNLGVQKSPAGKLRIQFQYPSQLKDHPNSQLFKTEELEVPSIAPGDQLIVNFKTTQTLPNIFDYVRNDWAMREYEAILTVNETGKEYVIGIGNLTYSAYYYEAPQKQTPTVIPAS